MKFLKFNSNEHDCWDPKIEICDHQEFQEELYKLQIKQDLAEFIEFEENQKLRCHISHAEDENNKVVIDLPPSLSELQISLSIIQRHFVARRVIIKCGVIWKKNCRSVCKKH